MIYNNSDAVSQDLSKPGLSVPVYSIFDRDIPLAHFRACIIVNPISLAEDKREPHETIVAACEGGACAILPDREQTPELPEDAPR